MTTAEVQALVKELEERDRLLARLGPADNPPTLDLRAAAALRDSLATIARLEQEQRAVRELLWLNHGCPVSVLYGDDGEMQCNHMGPFHLPLDFKLDTFVELVKKATAAYVALHATLETENARLREALAAVNPRAEDASIREGQEPGAPQA